MATLNENIARVKTDFGGIKRELVNKGASIPSGTPTSQYANIIKNMSTGDAQEAYEQGRQDVIAESKYIPKTATGKVISLNNVSEVAHKVKVYGDNQEIDVYGKNLCDYRQAKARNTTTFVTINDDESVTYDGNYYFIIPVTLPRGATCTVSFESPRGTNTKWSFVYDDNTETPNALSGVSFVTSTEKEVAKLYIYPDILDANSVKTTTIKNILITLGSGKSYEPYTNQTITATPVGTEIDSMCPNMTFLADSDITVDYYSSFGMNEEWSRFWDTYQANGTRTEYSYGFAGYGWTDETFKPKYDIRPSVSTGLFNYSKITDLVDALDRAGVILDLSDTNGASVFRSPHITRVPFFVAPKTSGGTYMFNGDTKLHTIEGIECSETTVYVNWFTNCTALTHVIFSGVIANDINLQWSPLLDDETLISLSVVLKDLWLDSDGNPIEDNIADRTLTVPYEVLERLTEIPYPIDDYYNPLGEYNCFDIILTKGWNMA